MYRSLIAVIIGFICLPAVSQEVADTAETPKISSKYFDAINKKAETLTQDLDKKSKKVLARMQKQEVKLQKKLAKIDSIKNGLGYTIKFIRMPTMDPINSNKIATVIYQNKKKILTKVIEDITDEK